MHLVVTLFCACTLSVFTVAKSDTNTTTTSTNTNSATAIFTTKPGCQPQCGDLTVPYPFGIGLGSGCSMESWFDINCSTSFNPPKAFLSTTNIEVYNISINQLRISNVLAGNCYNKSGDLVLEYEENITLTASPYTFSDANVLTVIGCDDFALMSVSEQLGFSSGCMTFCSKAEDVPKYHCSGFGCCQTRIPKGHQYYYAGISSVYNHTEVWSFDPCGYSFLGEKDSFIFNGTSDLSDPIFVNKTKANVPILLDWAIGNQTCAQAQQDSNAFACQLNSNCSDSDSGLGGYRCRCLYGYEGNPYLSPGCQDINECADPNKHMCERNCVNIPGSYNCTCPQGYYGDGRKNSDGCIPKNSKFPVFKFLLGNSLDEFYCTYYCHACSIIS